MIRLKEKLLKINKKDDIDLSNELDKGFDAIEIGKNRFTLRDFRVQCGHDDSLPYYAILCNNGNPLCECLNDGWGGMTDLKPLSAYTRALIESIKLKLKTYKWQYGDNSFEFSLDFIADMLATNENNKLNRTLKGKC